MKTDIILLLSLFNVTLFVSEMLSLSRFTLLPLIQHVPLNPSSSKRGATLV